MTNLCNHNGAANWETGFGWRCNDCGKLSGNHGGTPGDNGHSTSQLRVDIKEIANTIIRGEQAIKFPLKIHSGWVSDQNDNHILDIRGWGYLQYADNNKGAELQDGIGQWVVDTLNKEWNNTK